MRNPETNKLYEKLKKEAAEGGYLLNPNEEFVLDLMEGLLTNIERFGYMACPCRMPEGRRDLDLDIICPCDYRDPDLDEFGGCYCALYVSQAVYDGKQELESIPERRPENIHEQTPKPAAPDAQTSSPGTFPIWRCKVCGYLCARPQPPLRCPVCKADKDRFARFSLTFSGGLDLA